MNIIEELYYGNVVPNETNAKLSAELKELIKLLRENDNPEKVASYMFSLFLDYLRTHVPSQEKHAADPLESARRDLAASALPQ